MCVIGDHVYVIDFHHPFKNPGWATERIKEMSCSDGTELVDIFKLSMTNISDLRDVIKLRSTICHGGRIVYAQKPKVPRYWTANQEDMAEAENSVHQEDPLIPVEPKNTDKQQEQINKVSKANANQLLADDDMDHIAFIVPEGYLVYDIKDKYPTSEDRVVEIALREMANKEWYVDETAPKVFHTIWWGYYTYRIKKVDANRKIVEKKKQSVNGLLSAFQRGTTL